MASCRSTLRVPERSLTDDQDQAPQATLAARIEEVRVVFSALDGGGRLVTGIRPQDVAVTDDRKEIPELTSFTQVADLPLRLGLLVDVSESMEQGLSQEQKAAIEFLQRIVRPEYDEVFVAAFDSRITLHPYAQRGPGMLTLVKASRSGGQTALYDAVSASCMSGLMTVAEELPVRRALVVFSDGEDTQSYHTLQDAIGWAQRSEVAVYAISIRGSQQSRRGRAVLEELTAATGGRAFVLSSQAQLAGVLEQIEEELRSEYVLTYRRSLAPAHGGFHHLQVVIRNQPSIRVNCRQGYDVPSESAQ